MTVFGTNVDWEGKTGVEDLGALNCGIIRFAPRQENDLTDYCNRLRTANIAIMLVVDKTSWEQELHLAVERYQSFDPYWQIGNEMNSPGPSSWQLKPEELNTNLEYARQLLPNTKKLVCGAIATGEASYLDSVDHSLVDYTSFHLYDYNNPTQVIDTYQDFVSKGKPSLLTEFGAPTTEISEPEQESYIYTVCSLANQLSIPIAIQFCISDWMVNGYGIIDRNGHKKPAYYTLRDAGQNRVMDLNPIIRAFQIRWQSVVILDYHHDWGIPKFWRLHPEIGPPLSSEILVGDFAGHTVQPFANAVVDWNPNSGASIIT